MRYLYTDPQPSPPPLGDCQLVTPTRLAGRDFNNAACDRLESLAKTLLQRQGWRLVPPVLARRQFRRSVAAILQVPDPSGTSRTLKPTLEELLRAQLDLQVLQNHGSERLATLARLADHYRRALAEQQWLDGAELLWRAAAWVQPSDRRAYCFYGYFQPRRDQQVLITAIAGPGSQWVLPVAPGSPLFAGNAEVVATLEQQGWAIAPHTRAAIAAPAAPQAQPYGSQLQQQFLQPAREAAPSPHLRASISPTLEAEVRAVLAQVKAQLAAGVPARDLVLVARDPDRYGPVLEDVAWEYHLPLRLLYEIPLRATRLGAWLGLVLTVIAEEAPYEPTAKLLAHPLTQQLPSEAWAQARQQRPRGFAAWEALGLDLQAYVWPPETAPRATWMQRWQALTQACQLRRRVSRWPRELVAYYRLETALSDLASAAPEPCSRTEFLEELEELRELLQTPAQPGRGGVELHAPLTLVGARYAQVFVLGAVEGWLPALPTVAPGLDFHDRRTLAAAGLDLDTAATLARQEELSFYFLLGVPMVGLHLSGPERDRDRQALLPSPYLAQLGLRPQAPPALPLASWEEVRRVGLPLEAAILDAVGDRARQAWWREQRRESAAPADEYDGVVGLPLDPREHPFSATQLLALGQCPFKWFAGQVLRLQEPEETPEALPVHQRGQLYHRCLELLLQPGQTAAAVSQLSPTALRQAFLQAEQDLGLPAWPAWEAQREEQLALLALNLQAPDFLAPDATIVALESWFELPDWYGLRVVGRIDRLDRSPRGLRVLDYKTGSSTPPGVQEAEGEATLEVQLALYQAAMAAQYGDTPIQADYYSLKKRQVLKAKPGDLRALERFSDQVRHRLQTGSYPVAPDRQRQACRFCAYDLVCRQGPRLERKRAEAESGGLS